MLASASAGCCSAVGTTNCRGASRAAYSVGAAGSKSLSFAPSPTATTLVLSVGTSDAATMTAMKLALEQLMFAQGLVPMLWASEHAPRLAGKRPYSSCGRDPAAASCAMRKCAHSPPCNARDDPQQMPRLRIAMKRLRNMSDALGQSRCCPGQSLGDFWQRPLGCRCNRPSDDRQQLACCHPDQGQKMFRRFIFALCFRRKLAKVFHHGVGIDLANRIESGFQFVLALILVFAFTENGAEEVFAFAKNVAQEVFPFAQQVAEELFTFRLIFELFFELVFQLTFVLICHDESSPQM